MTTTNTKPNKTVEFCKECGDDIVWSGPGDPWCDRCAARSLGNEYCVADLIADHATLRARCERLEALLSDAAKSLAEAIDGHDSREEGSGYRPATGPWRASLRDIKAALAGEGK